MKTLFIIFISFWIGWKHGDVVVLKIKEQIAEMIVEYSNVKPVGETTK